MVEHECMVVEEMRWEENEDGMEVRCKEMRLDMTLYTSQHLGMETLKINPQRPKNI